MIMMIIPAINDDGNLQTLIDKVDKVSKFWKTGKADSDLIRYIPYVLPVTRQNLIAGIDPRQAYASETYTDNKNFDFTINLAPNTYTNYAKLFYLFNLLRNHKKPSNSMMTLCL